MSKTSSLALGLALTLRLALPAQEACPQEKPFGFALTAWGRTPAAEPAEEDIYLLPGESGKVDVTAWLVTNPPGETATIELCAFFAMYVAHDSSVLRIVDLDTKTTDAARSYIVVGRIDEDGPQQGFLAGTPTCLLGGTKATFTGSFSLVRATYALVAPPANGGALIATTLRFEDKTDAPRVLNLVHLPDGGPLIPCLRPLELRFHFTSDSDFVRADANFDQQIDVSDAVTVLRSLFRGGAPIRCSDAADSNDDGRIDLADAVYVFAYLFLAGPEPPAPFPVAGPDPTPDDNHCTEHS